METDDGVKTETLESTSAVMSKLAQSNTADTREAGRKLPFPGIQQVISDFTCTLHLDRRQDAEHTGEHDYELFRFQNNNAYGIEDTGVMEYIEDIYLILHCVSMAFHCYNYSHLLVHLLVVP